MTLPAGCQPRRRKTGRGPHRLLSGCVFAFAVQACLPGSLAALPQGDRTAIVHTNVIPMDAERILPDHTVLVEAGRIVWVGPSSQASIPTGAAVVDGRGKYLVPGLTDAHVHLSPSEFPLLLTHGITTIVQMHGVPDHVTWRRPLLEGILTGPTMLTAGPVIAGHRQGFPFFVIASTVAEGERFVREHQAAGYDLIKVYDGLSRQVFDAVLHTADSLGMPVVGHAPMEVGLDRVVHSGQRVVEHADQVFYALHRQRDGVMQLPATAVDRALEAWRGSRAAFTPTLAGLEIDYRTGSPWVDSLIARPDTAHLARIWGDRWPQTVRTYSARPDSARRATRLQFLSLLKEFTRRANAEGITLVAGTDSPNGLLVPGLALHDELAAYVRAGLSPYQALRTATANAGRVFGLGEPFGRILSGERADLLLLQRNPLEDIANLRTPSAVMVRGRWIKRP